MEDKRTSSVSRRDFLRFAASTGVVVAGSSVLAGCGSTTATAAEAGAKVLIIEKAALPGGSMARCGGAIQGAVTKVQEALGITDSVELFYEWVNKCTNQNSELCPTDIIHAHAEPDTTANSGPELFEPLYLNINQKIEEGSITVEYKTALKELITNADGAVIGVVATTEAGDINIKATKGVMLATGGFPAGDDMKMRFLQEALDYTTYMCYDCTGDGIKAAMGIGADLFNMCNFYPIPVAQVYHYNVQYNDMFNSWLDMDAEGYMNVPAPNMAECHGGVKINADAQVLDIEGNVIPHLYASGCDTGTNIWGVPGNYPGCGSYVAFSMVFGRIAGVKMVAEAEIV